jgi:hypothetical protein
MQRNVEPRCNGEVLLRISKRMNANVTELESSHVPMLSQPTAVIDVIRKAAASL